ncbi:MAG TPA: radical SAM protein, partial [Verrucomicrobiota bacterium]|nr:radical SAM protein [Verrucomicrobiota bacterium]
VNMNPDKLCNFDCLYCEVDRTTKPPESRLLVSVMASELRRTLLDVTQGRLRERPWYQHLPDELLQLRQVALSGDGEPTLAPNFAEAVEAVVHVRALGEFPFFKIVLLTNAAGLDQPQVQSGLTHLTKSDEIWAKLDGGTEQYLNTLARPKGISLDKILSNILLTAKRRPVVIQSLFPAINGNEPPLVEIEEYAHRLKELKEAGAQIKLVQIYSATRPMKRPECGHLPLKVLSHIAQSVRQISGLKAEVF